jgi:hypothetical protein
MDRTGCYLIEQHYINELVDEFSRSIDQYVCRYTFYIVVDIRSGVSIDCISSKDTDTRVSFMTLYRTVIINLGQLNGFPTVKTQWQRRLYIFW